jgi:Kdo2-lipid IVA lauroyltransferase/acyltransferase
LIDFASYIIVRALNRILAFVPISASLWIGRRLGTAAFFFNKKRRLVAYANLKSAFAKEKSPPELRRITKRVYQNMVQTFLEVLNLTKVNRKYVDKYIEIINFERIQNAATSGRGTILLTAHFGDWELSSLVSSVVGFPILVLVREQKMKRLNELLNRLRESNGCKVIRKGMDVKNILKALHGKNIVGILSDQDAGKSGVFVDFFGRPTSYHSGPFEIAKHTDSLILPNLIVRTGGPHHKLYLEEYIDFRGKDGPDAIRENIQRFAKLLESFVRKHPDQWLWLHKRWKSTPVRTILVLNDGKTGHLNQSLAITKAIQRARAAQGYKPDDTKVVTIDVKYKNNFARTALATCAAFSSWRCHGCMRCMKLCLAEETYDELMKQYCDYVVSCGSSTAAVNIFMAGENNAKNIIVMKPGIAMWPGKFNLAVIPRHDNPKMAKNVVVTELAPNLLDEEKMKRDGESLKNYTQKEIRGAVSLFVGGDNPEFTLTKEITDAVTDGLVKFARQAGMPILATTSRRTPPEADSIIKNKLRADPNCKLLVVANEKNFEFTVGGMLALCRIAVVSEESISMISEAISAGKKVVVFKLANKKDGVTKHERALKHLEDRGHITVTEARDLVDALKRAASDTTQASAPRDMQHIHEALRRLV